MKMATLLFFKEINNKSLLLKLN